MFYGRFCGRRKRKTGGVLNILLRACRCARVWTVRKRAGKVKKYPAGRKIHSGKCGFFCRKVPEEVRKWWKREEKFLSLHGKKHENYPDDEEKHVRNWVMESEKADFSFEKIQEKRKKYENEMKNFSVPLGERQEKLFRRSEKISKNGWSGWKSSRFFSQADGKMQKRTGKEAEKFIESSEKSMKKCSWSE